MVKIKDLFSQFNHQYKENYDFHDIDTNLDVDLYMSPDEGFTFANFSSVDKGWWLTKGMRQRLRKRDYLLSSLFARRGRLF